MIMALVVPSYGIFADLVHEIDGPPAVWACKAGLSRHMVDVGVGAGVEGHDKGCGQLGVQRTVLTYFQTGKHLISTE